MSGLSSDPSLSHAKYIMFRGYHGEDLGGNNANKLLSHVDTLERDIRDDNQPQLLSVVDCLRNFQTLKKEAFGISIGENVDEAVKLFKSSYEDLVSYVEDTFEGVALTVSWKVHIAACHIDPFLSKSSQGLDVYSEQA